MGQSAMARASYLVSARAMALCRQAHPKVDDFCAAMWSVFTPPLTQPTVIKETATNKKLLIIAIRYLHQYLLFQPRAGKFGDMPFSPRL